MGSLDYGCLAGEIVVFLLPILDVIGALGLDSEVLHGLRGVLVLEIFPESWRAFNGIGLFGFYWLFCIIEVGDLLFVLQGLSLFKPILVLLFIGCHSLFILVVIDKLFAMKTL